jgi:hypothetical protein
MRYRRQYFTSDIEISYKKNKWKPPSNIRKKGGKNPQASAAFSCKKMCYV